MLGLYYHPVSTFSQRVRIALIENQFPAELVEIGCISLAAGGGEVEYAAEFSEE
jgi:glutathione S-transferase